MGGVVRDRDLDLLEAPALTHRQHSEAELGEALVDLATQPLELGPPVALVGRRLLLLLDPDPLHVVEAEPVLEALEERTTIVGASERSSEVRVGDREPGLDALGLHPAHDGLGREVEHVGQDLAHLLDRGLGPERVELRDLGHDRLAVSEELDEPASRRHVLGQELGADHDRVIQPHAVDDPEPLPAGVVDPAEQVPDEDEQFQLLLERLTRELFHPSLLVEDSWIFGHHVRNPFSLWAIHPGNVEVMSKRFDRDQMLARADLPIR